MKHHPLWTKLWLLFPLLLLTVGTIRAEAAALAWYADTGATQELGDIRELPESEWQSFDSSEILNLGFSDNRYWIRIEIEPKPVNRVVEIGYPLLDDVRLYWVSQGDVIARHETGDRRAFSSRPIHHRNFVFLVPTNTEPVTAYVRVQTQGSVQIPVQVVPSADFLAAEQLSYGWQTAFLGIMLAMVLYNLFVFVIVRHPAYLWYVMTVVVLTLVQLNFHGLLFQWLWPDTPVINRYFTTPAIALNIGLAVAFTMSFLAVRKYSLWAHRFFVGVIVASVLTFLYGLFGSYQSGIVLVSVIAAVVTPVAWLIGILIWRQGQVLAGFYVLAWTPLLLGHLVLALSKIGLLPRNLFTELAPQAGIALEVILLSFALAYRITLERRRRLEAQEHALEVQLQANRTLEARVQERTEELELANEQLRTMSLTDGLTKVANRRRFDEKLVIEWNRALRHGHPLSLLLLDIDHFKEVNDELGHLVGDDCLVWLAGLCHQEIQRAGDLLARYGGEEFSVLLPATSEEGALQVAERLRAVVAASPLPAREGTGEVNLTVSIGVASMLPGNGDIENEPLQLVQRADEALYAAKHGGRNRVMVYGRSQTSAESGSQVT